MTVEQFKDKLEDFLTIVESGNYDSYYIQGMADMLDFAVRVAKNNMITLDTTVFELDKLENGKCYTISFDLDEIYPSLARQMIALMQEQVKDRNITLVGCFKQLEIEED